MEPSLEAKLEIRLGPKVIERGAVMRCVIRIAALLILIAGALAFSAAQTTVELQNYFKETGGLSQDQIAAIRSGQPVAKTLTSRTPAEVFVLGAVYVNAPPESYLKFAGDFDRLRSIPGYLAIEPFSTPPQLADLRGFALDSDDIKALKTCKPGSCRIQLPASTMEQLQQSINWSAPDADDEVNQFIQKLALQRLITYQKEGDRILGAVYNDKHEPTNVADQFKYMLSHSSALAERLPNFYNYLLAYPDAKPANVENSFYWDNVKFGLKPTLRIVHVVTMRGTTPEEPAYVIAEKQLYSSHYFETALDLTFCVRGDAAQPPGFYLIKVMASEQAGLTGMKGSIVRKVAVGKSVTSLDRSLTAIKSALEQRETSSK
jgi:hypothetical protein